MKRTPHPMRDADADLAADLRRRFLGRGGLFRTTPAVWSPEFGSLMVECFPKLDPLPPHMVVAGAGELVFMLDVPPPVPGAEELMSRLRRLVAAEHGRGRDVTFGGDGQPFGVFVAPSAWLRPFVALASRLIAAEKPGAIA